MGEITARPTQLLSYSKLQELYNSNTPLLTPVENLLIKMATGRNSIKVDFGALCFIERQFIVPTEKNHKSNGLLVNKDSFCPKRASLLDKALAYFLGKTFLDMSERSIKLEIENLRKFLRFTDSKGFYDDLYKLEDARRVLTEYHKYLHSPEREYDYKSKKPLKSSTIEQYISIAKEIFLVGLGITESELLDGIDLSTFKSPRNPTLPPDDEDFSLVIKNVAFLFKTFFNVAMNKTGSLPSEKFPIKLEFTNEEQSRLYFPFPQSRTDNKKGLNYVDYINGGFSSFDTLKKQNQTLQQDTYRKQIISYQTKLEEANKSITHPERWFAAEVCLKCFNILFQATISSNNDDLFNFKIDNKLVNENLERVGFVNYKKRKGSNVEYEFGSYFYKTFFLPFLKLRKRAIGDCHSDFDNLLFRLQKKGGGTIKLNEFSQPEPIKENDRILSESFKFLNNTFKIELPSISVSKFRALKSDRTYEKFDAYVASIINQNSESTTLKHYTSGTPKKHFVDLNTFFKLQASKRKNVQSNYGCQKRSNPSNIKDLPEGFQNIKADCNNPFSCYLCENYDFFPDEFDTRKILEHKFIIENYYKALASNLSHFDNTYGTTLRIIDFLVEGVGSLSKEHKLMVKKVKGEIFDDYILSSFISSKIESLYSMGVLR